MEEHKDPTRLEHVQKKMREGIILDRWIAYWHFRNYRIGFTYGSFDPLNPRCVEFLYQAVESLKTLVVGLYSDAMIRKLTGNHDPQADRQRACHETRRPRLDVRRSGMRGCRGHPGRRRPQKPYRTGSALPDCGQG